MEPRAGCRLPVLVERVVNGALLVSLRCGERSFSGILLDCTQKSGLFGLPPPARPPKAQAPPASSRPGPVPEEDGEAAQLPAEAPLSPDAHGGPEPPLPLLSPLPAGSLPPNPPYFEGAPFPHPLWLRSTYNQWVPQPPPRAIKPTRRRLSRSRDPGRLTPSTIRLRPRQVLCARCKSAPSPEEAGPGPPAAPRARRRLGSGPDRRPRPHDGAEGDAPASAAFRSSKRPRRGQERPRGSPVPRSPVIKISYSTPQGEGEVMEIPSRVHGSLEPFRPLPAGDRDAIPKLKLTRPPPPGPGAPPPKIRLKPHRPGAGERQPVYTAELVQELNGARHTATDLSSGSSGEDDDFQRLPRARRGREGLAFLVSYPQRKADSASELGCSSDSLEEAKSSGSEVASPDMRDLPSGHERSVPPPSSTEHTCPTVPPLTVRLQSQSVPPRTPEDGKAVAVGDIVWGKIPGFPWWPARVLDISLGQKEHGEPSWQEAKVSWFGSPTTSFLSISKLSPFSEFFKLRFNRKKKGMYRKAITEAAHAARHVAPEIGELLTQLET
ncbi:PWWP domain-containing protein 2B [Tamandua tetradactyla]|uniref:PWWP domain-containing protein 2B n=1 Tax=Tamandua tetradactyla TaxID=48850 RepID=UPI004054975B